jgi:hypothetical protein
MTDHELALEGFQLCTMGGDCDTCLKDTPQGEYFWERTSYEYVEGDYWCRACAVAEVGRLRELYNIVIRS